jgi:hypothetical protein
LQLHSLKVIIALNPLNVTPITVITLVSAGPVTLILITTMKTATTLKLNLNLNQPLAWKIELSRMLASLNTTFANMMMNVPSEMCAHQTQTTLALISVKTPLAPVLLNVKQCILISMLASLRKA